MRFGENKSIIVVLALFLVLKLILFGLYKNIWWDSAVYIGMGKYIYSLGNSGLWENSRPVMWPLILGFFWKIGANPVVLGRLIEIIFASGCIFLTFKIAKKIGNQTIGIISAALLAFSPTFFFFSGIMLSEILSLLFALLGVYFFLEKRYFLSGLFFGLAFLTRFLQLFAFAAAALFIAGKKNNKNLTLMLFGFAAITFPYLMLNQIMYNNPFTPFLQQVYLTNSSGWPNHHPAGYYAIELFKENILWIFSLIGLIIAVRSKDANKRVIAAIFIFYFIFFNAIKQKEMRFLIALLPYMYFLAAYALNSMAKSKFALYSIYFVISLSLAASFNTANALYKAESAKINPYNEMQAELSKIENQKIWVSNPILALSSDIKIDNLMYYVIFNDRKTIELIDDAKNADFIFMDTCDLECNPKDPACEASKSEFLKFLKANFKLEYSAERDDCRQYVYRN